MAAGIASTLLFVYPIMVALIMAMVFKEKLALQTIVCMLLALGGIGLLYKSEDGSTLSLIGTLLVFASSLSYAIYIVGINQTSLKNVATLKVTFYVLLFGLSLFVARLLYSGVLTHRTSGICGPICLHWLSSPPPYPSSALPVPSNISAPPRPPFSAHWSP